MRRTKRLKPILALLLAAVMLSGLLPAQPAAAEDLLSIVSEPYICCRIKVAKVTSGGTDSDMYCDVNFRDNTTYSFLMDKSDYNDFEQGDNDSYWFSIKKPVWMIKSFDVRIGGSDGVAIEEIEIGINSSPNSSNTCYHKVKKTYSGDARWLDGKGDEKTLSYSLKRSLKDESYSTFTSAFSNTVYLSENPSTSDVDVTWDPKCDYDGIFKPYNPFNYADAPDLSLTVHTSEFGQNGWTEAKSNDITSLFTKQKNGKGFTYTPSAVYAKMGTDYVGMRVDVKLNYNTDSSSGTTAKTVSYYIYRRQFGIKSSESAVTSAYYTAQTDNYFFNSDNKQVSICIPLQNNVNYQLGSIFAVMADEVKLYYGNETSFAVADGNIEKIGNDLYATFTLDTPFESPTSGSVGMKLLLRNVRVGLATDLVHPFYLYDKDTVGRQVTLGGTSETLGAGDYYQFFSKYKVDTVSPENKVSLQEQGVSGNAAFSDAWHQKVTLLTSSTETIYKQGNSSPDTNAGYLTLTIGNGIKVRVGNSSNAVSTFDVPTVVGSSTATTITLYGQAEYSNMSITVSGQDFAGNKFTKTYSGLKMDTLAPRVTLKRSNDANQASDGTRSAYFAFQITDASGTGKVNYCFVRSGEDLPAEGAGSEHSGVITDMIGQWCFVSQSSSSTTAVLKLEDGESFNGTLYYYAMDGLGNKTGTTSVPISVQNQKAECTYTVKTTGGEDYAYPQPAYSVVFTPDAGCEVYYRYMGMADYVLYDGATNPGDSKAVTGSLLNGEQILEYMVRNTTSGNEVFFNGDNGIILIFDNEDPRLTLSQTSGGSSMAVQTFTLGATDLSGVAFARYEVLLGTEDTVAASGDLTVEEGTGVLSTGLSVGSDLGLGNGSYRLKLYATDHNGVTASSTSGAFSIRVQPPAVEVTAVNGAAPGDPNVTGSLNNTLTLTVADTFAGDGADQTHNAYCRVSGDGSTYTDWILLGELTKGTGNALSLTAELSAFPELNEGTNQIYLQVICAESEKTLTSTNISAASVFRLDPPARVLLDLTAPTAQWSVTCSRNNTALTGDVTVSDGVTMYPTVICATTGVELIRDQGNGNRYHLVYNVPADGNIIDKITLYMTDEAGNTGTLQIADELSLLDLDGPGVVFSTANTQQGDRVDAQVTVELIDDHPGHIDVQFNEAEGSGRYSTVKDNNDGTYTVLLRGYNSTSASPFTVLAYDDLGNVTSMEAPPVTVIYPEFDLVGLFSQPAFAQDSTPVGLQFNVPALAVPLYVVQSGSETLAEAADRAFQEAGSRLDSLAATTAYSTAASCELRHDDIYSVTADAVAYELEKDYGSGWQSRLGEYGSGNWPCYVLAKDEFGNSKVFLVRPDTQFEMVFPIDLIVEQYYGGQKIDVFPNDTIVAGTHMPDPSVDPDAAPAEYAAEVIIRAYNFRDADGNFYLRQSSGGAYTYVDQSGRVLTAEEFAAEAPGAEELDYALFPYTILTADDSRIADLQAPDAEDHDGKGTLFLFDRSSGNTIAVAAGDYGWAFAQLAFAVNAEANAAVDSSTVSVGYVNRPGNAAGDPRTVYIRSFTASGSGSTAEAALNPADIWLNQTLQTGRIVAMQPTITKSWQQSSLAAEVQLNVTASGAGETRLIKVLMKTEDGWTVVDQWNGEGDGPNLSTTITEEGTYCVYAEDEYGLSTLSEEFDITIRTDPITEDDFNITMEAYDYGWVTVTDDSRPASEARFTVTITDSGMERGLIVKDPEGGVVTLTYDSPTCTLVLTDDYGYRYEKLLTYVNLIEPPAPDVTAPTVEYSFTNENKTNKPYEVLITAADEESGVLSVTLAGSSVMIPLTEEGGLWIGTISANGSYMITAEDRAGNAVKKIFSVTNIDDSPVTAELEYSTTALTQDIVTVTLSFNKHNVTVTGMERASGYASMDESAGKVFFPENGTVTVWFRDEYGNEGVAVVTVSNIYDVPPRLKAVPVLAADGLSVSVTFEMETDAYGAPLDIYRKLSDLTVIRNGVSYSADQARYVLRENGVCTFTVVDQVGLMQVIEVEVKDIDRDAPVVTSVSWNYTYLDADGNERNAVYSLGSIDGAGYRIAIDKYYRTNRDVTVSVTTDKPTTIIGSHDGEAPVLKHELIYHENGLYVYNLQKTNGLSVSYGVDVEIIDKTPPVIELEGPTYLLFVEGRDSGSVRDMLTDYAARDEYLGRVTDLTAAVKTDFGGLDPDVLENNTFDKSKPYTVQYSVKDAAGNETVVTRTVVLVGMNDVLVTVNGVLPNAASMLESDTGDLTLELVNFSGVAYATYASGQRTFGQMKTMGTVLKQENGAFRLTGLKRGWYTFFIQTETRDYFNIYVFVD